MKDNEQKVFDEAKERRRIVTDAWGEIYGAARDDMRFTYDVGDGQWPADIRRMRNGRPMITVNKLQKFVRQVRGDFAMNRPSMKVIPADSKSDPQVAELYNGILRQIEYLSNAATVYDTAYSSAVASSVGYWRIITKYVSPDSFEQDIYLERVPNPLSIMFDPYAKAFNLEDAEYCFVEDWLTEEQFKRKYPKKDMANYSSDKTELIGQWIQDKRICICEYWVKEKTEKKLYLLDSGDVATEEMLPQARLMGRQVKRERTTFETKVKRYLLSGAEILEEAEWAGTGIPIIPMFGDEVIVEGKRHYLSLIRGAKSSQQMYNYWASTATENAMMTPKAPFVVDHRQLKGFENEWEDANTAPRMYIRYNAIAGLQKPSREPQAQIPSQIVNMMQSTAYDIEDHLGRYESSKGEAGNERSGRAIIARIRQSDKGTFTFIDNATRSIVAGLRQIVELIPKIYDTQRALVILGEDGDRKSVDVNMPSIGMDGEPVMVNDLSVGKYDVIAQTGASFGSKREETVKMLLESMQYAPAVAPVILPFIFKNSDWPGATEVYEALMKAMSQQPVAPGAPPPPRQAGELDQYGFPTGPTQ